MSMAIFNCYVSSPEGTKNHVWCLFQCGLSRHLAPKSERKSTSVSLFWSRTQQPSTTIQYSIYIYICFSCFSFIVISCNFMVFECFRWLDATKWSIKLFFWWSTIVQLKWCRVSEHFSDRPKCIPYAIYISIYWHFHCSPSPFSQFSPSNPTANLGPQSAPPWARPGRGGVVNQSRSSWWGSWNWRTWGLRLKRQLQGVEHQIVGYPGIIFEFPKWQEVEVLKNDTLWWTNSLLLKMAIEIADFPIKNDDVPLLC